MTDTQLTSAGDVDALLRDSFARIAEPGDPAGVAEAIRTRMDAGDTGTPASTSGFGGGTGGSWLPWGAMIVIAGLIGGGLGLTGLVGSPAPEELQLTVLAVDATTDAFDCPGGSAVSTFSANERALVVARTADAQWLGVRDSYDYSRTVWLPVSVVTVDADQGDVESVAVKDCVVPIVVVNTPDPTKEPEEEPGPTADTQSPSLTKASASPGTITMDGYSAYCGTDVSTVSVGASDNVGVTSVKATWSDGSANLTRSGSMWSFHFRHAVPNDTTFTITLVARDAAGNVSAPRTTKVTVTYCLI